MADLSFEKQAGISELQHQLAQREAELQIINSVQLGLAEHLDVQSIYDLVGDKIRDIFQAQVVMISTYDKHTETIEHRYAIENGQRIYAPGHHPIRGFRIWVVETRQPVLVSENVGELAEKLGQYTLPGTVTPKTWLGVPMIVNDQVTGILSLQDIEKEHAFDDAVVRLLQTLAASMSVALENARLWEQEHLYRQALEREFEIGRKIQSGFLPESVPQPAGWQVAAMLRSAREVAGDFYDVFELPGGKLGLITADVCDKGLGAALFMTLFRSLLRAASNMDVYMRSSLGGPRSAAERLKNAVLLTNNYIAQTHGHTGMFATVFFGILDPHTSILTYVNCGHLSPLLIAPHGVKQVLRHTGPALGALLEAQYDILEVHIDHSDLLFIFTDGLSEAEDPGGQVFDMPSIYPLLASSDSLPQILSRIHTQLEMHVQGADQFDDVTMLALRRL